MDIQALLELAEQLCAAERLTLRQYEIYTRKVKGYSMPEILRQLATTPCMGSRRAYFYDLSHARVVVEQAQTEAAEGRIRLGHTLGSGGDVRFRADATASLRVVTNESNWPSVERMKAERKLMIR